MNDEHLNVNRGSRQPRSHRAIFPPRRRDRIGRQAQQVEGHTPPPANEPSHHLCDRLTGLLEKFQRSHCETAQTCDAPLNHDRRGCGSSLHCNSSQWDIGHSHYLKCPRLHIKQFRSTPAPRRSRTASAASTARHQRDALSQNSRTLAATCFALTLPQSPKNRLQQCTLRPQLSCANYRPSPSLGLAIQGTRTPMTSFPSPRP